MRVWIVEYNDGSDSSVYGVYATEELAEAKRQAVQPTRTRKLYFIESYDVVEATPPAETVPYLSWKNEPVGARRSGRVARDLTLDDVRRAEFQGRPLTNPDGTPKLVLDIPLIAADGAEAILDVPQRSFRDLAVGLILADVYPVSSTPAGLTSALKAGDFLDVTFKGYREGPSRVVVRRFTFEVTPGNGVPMPPSDAAVEREQSGGFLSEYH